MKSSTRRAVTIFGVTSLSAFWVNAIGHAWLIWRRHPLVQEHRATLEFRSALLGDSTLLPLLNVLLDRQLIEWGDGLHLPEMERDRLRRALVAGLGVTMAFHFFQGIGKLTNWTMPRPWRWTMLGFYHAIYMTLQGAIVAYFCSAAGIRIRNEGSRALLTRRLTAALMLLSGWFTLLYKDYY